MVHRFDSPNAKERLIFVEAIAVRGSSNQLYETPPGGLDCHRLLVFHQAMEIELVDSVLSVEPNHMVYFPPGSWNRYGFEGRVWSDTRVRIVGSAVEGLLHTFQIPALKAIAIGKLVSAQNWVGLLQEELLSNSDQDVVVIRHLLSGWLRSIQLVRQKGEGRLGSVSEKYLRIKRLIDENPADLFSLDELSTMIGVSRAHLCVGFKNAIGMSPMQYAAKQRCLLAREYLEDYRYSIQKIAELCGYSDLYYFSKVFKKQFGKSPENYRRMLKQS